MRRVFESPLFTAPAKADLMEILSISVVGNWGESGDDLRVRRDFVLCSRPDLSQKLVDCYLRSCLPHLKVDMLLLVRQILGVGDVRKEYAALLHELDKKLAKVASKIEPDPEMDWRQQVRKSVQDFLAPITICWMDDGDTMSESDYAQRALDDVKARFERCASVLSPPV
jgi:hypothetical protein